MKPSSRALRTKRRLLPLPGTAMPAVLGTLLAAALCGDLWALTIYRFGGEDLPGPEEAEQEGVEFIQRSWLDPVDPDAGGSLFQVDLGNGTIRAQYYGVDENIALTAADRGEGVRESTRKDEQSAAVDGDLTTAWYPEQYLCASFDARQVASGRCSGDYKGIDRWTFGLGGFFYIDKVRIISGLGDEAAIMTNFRVSAASGRVASSTYGIASTRQVFNEMAEIRGNRSEFLDIEFPPHDRIDFINVQAAEHNREWAVYEIEVYARGYVESSSYVSDVIEFDRTMAWGDLKWSGSEDPGAEVRIHTRSGNTADQNLYWQYTGRGEKIPVEDARTYKRLKLGERAGTTYDRDNWTFWSAPYDFADSTGTPVVSLGPRRFFQFKVDVIPSSEAGGELDFLEFRVSEPLASGLIGEISPTRAQIAEPTAFTYYLQPFLDTGASGFDGLEVSTSSIINGVRALRIGEIDRPFEVTPLDGNGVELSGFPANRFELTFADTRLVAADSGTPVEIDFDARVLRSGAAFAARVFDSTQPLAVRQKVAPGDANNLVEGNTLSVSTSAAAELLLQTEVLPAVITPNDDRVNDLARISYDLLEIIGDAEVSVEISDLSGRVVRQVYAGRDLVGNYEREWDGRDDAGEVVPPGIYLYRIEVDTDRDREAVRLGLVNVAY